MMRSCAIPSFLFLFLLSAPSLGSSEGSASVNSFDSRDISAGPPVLTIPRPPRFDPRAHRLKAHEFRPPGPGDSRSPCPGLNSLANHGFLPRNGQNVNIINLIIGSFLGLGVSPELSALVGAVGYASSGGLAAFKLEDLRKHLFLIEHDCSFSREDDAVGDNNAFSRPVWNVALKELQKARRGIVTPIDLGRAKGERIEAQKTRNPRTNYGARSFAFGALEVGLIMASLGGVPARAPLPWVRSLFEEERMPTHLGWKPTPFALNTFTALGWGTVSLAGDRKGFQHFGQTIRDTPADILATLIGAARPRIGRFKRDEVFGNMRFLLETAGFNTSGVDELSQMMDGRTPS